MAQAPRFAWLARSASGVGTALVSGAASLGYQPGTADAREWGQRLMMWQCSGNPASGELMVSLLGDQGGLVDLTAAAWISATAFSMAAGATGSAIFTSYWPWMVFQLSWVSAGARTATINAAIMGGPAGF